MVDRIERYRSGLVKTTAGIVILTLGKLLFWTPAGSRPYRQPIFPETLTLNHPSLCARTTSTSETCTILFQATPPPSGERPSSLADAEDSASESDLEDEDSGYEQVMAQKHYTHKDLSLSIYYIVNTSGDMYPLLADNGITVPSEPEQFQDHPSADGSYRLFSVDQHTHLVSCLNANGPATTTIEQFRAHRRRHDLHWQRWGQWLLGQTRLNDTRCLWIDLAISSDDTVQNRIDAKTHDRLQTLWQELAPQWQQRFPEP